MKRLSVVVTLFMVMAFVLGACATPTPETIIQTVEVPVVETQVVIETQTVVETQTVIQTVEVPAEVSGINLPRNETLYFNGLQWGSVKGWNPYASNTNNAMAIADGSNNYAAQLTMFESLYMYNMLDGKQYPLLADGDYTWNEDMTELTVKIKPAAKWSDGTPVTADDVAYTYASHLKYETNNGAAYKDYIETIEAPDPQTVVIKAKLDSSGKAVNPLQVAQYLSHVYVAQKAWTQVLEERALGDPAAFKNDGALDVVWSGPYTRYFNDNQKVVLVRDDNYWGQDASMWGKLPVPKYLAHTIFKDNAAGTPALHAGEVKARQNVKSNVKQQ